MRIKIIIIPPCWLAEIQESCRFIRFLSEAGQWPFKMQNKNYTRLLVIILSAFISKVRNEDEILNYLHQSTSQVYTWKQKAFDF